MGSEPLGREVAYKLKLAVKFAVWSNTGQPPIMGLWTTPTQPMN
jgi:hypothetical protein